MRSLENHTRRLRLLTSAVRGADADQLRWLLLSRTWRGLRDARERLQARVNFDGRHDFTGRSEGASTLLLVVAGHKPHLWPYTLTRLERYVPAGMDVCVISPGVRSAELDALAARNGWSRLVTSQNALALAQNLAIRHHPAARMIHKLDEDVLIADGYFERLEEGYRRVAGDGRFAPGYVAPLLNVNGFSYRLFLEALDLEQEYRERFGEWRQAALGIRAHHDGEAARWIWERTLPFDAVAARFAERPFGYSAVPHRFSIGAILFERALWEEIGGFLVVPRGGLGHEEEHFCKECLERSRPGIVAHDVLAGHFSFGPQDPAMRAALPELADGLRPAELAAR